MRSRLKAAFSQTVVLFLAICLYSTAPQAQELTRFKDFIEPINTILDYLKAGDMDGMDDFMAGIGFGEAGRIGSTFERWLAEDTVVEIDLLKKEELGGTLKRLTYAITDSTDSQMFFRFYVVKAKDGWTLYNFNFNTDLTKFFPSWKSP